MSNIRRLVCVLLPLVLLPLALRAQEVPLRRATLKVLNASGVAEIRFEVGRLEKLTLESVFVSPTSDDFKIVAASPEHLKVGPFNTSATPELRLDLRPAAMQGTVLRLRINTQEGGEVRLLIEGQDEIVVPSGQEHVHTISVEPAP